MANTLKIIYHSDISNIESKIVDTSKSKNGFYAFTDDDLPILIDNNKLKRWELIDDTIEHVDIGAYTFNYWKFENKPIEVGYSININDYSVVNLYADWTPTYEKIAETSLKEKMLSVLRIQNFYPQFMEVIGEELALMRQQIAKTKNYYNPYSQLEDGLLKIAETFGYNLNLIADSSLNMYQKEILSIPYRIRNKTTYDGYKLIFKMISKFGEIYNYYYSGVKLIRVVSWNDLLNLLNEYKYNGDVIGKTINGINPIPTIKNFSVISSGDSILLDTSYGNTYKWVDKNGNPRNEEGYAILDASLKGEGEKTNVDEDWVLDTNNPLIPTKHLGLEYAPTNYSDLSDDEEYLILSKYLQYLAVGTNYNRRVPIIPHIGIQLNCVVSDDGLINTLSNDEDYTIPNLRIKGCMSYVYVQSFSTIGTFYLDTEKEPLTIPPTYLSLDDDPHWNLDRDASKISGLPTIKDFKYISCGNGILSLPNNNLNVNDSDLFSPTNMILYYCFDDADDSLDIRDYSMNEYNGELKSINEYLTTKKIQGIVGKTVDFNGLTYIQRKNPISISSNQITINMWIKFTKNTIGGGTQYLLYMNFLKIWTDGENDLHVTLGNNNEYESVLELFTNEIYDLMIEIDYQNELRIYLNAEEKEVIDISSLSYSSQGSFYIGSDPNAEYLYQGVLDDFFIKNYFYSEKEKKNLYNKRLGIVTHLANKLACWELDIEGGEGKENDDELIINSYVNCNMITDEFIALAVDTDDEGNLDTNVSYIGQTNHYPIKKGSFNIKYQYFDGSLKKDVTINSDVEGNLYIIDENYNPQQRLIDGYIDFTNGEYELKAISTTKVNQEIVNMTSPTVSDSDDYYFNNEDFKEWMLDNYSTVEEIAESEITKDYDFSPNGLVPTDIQDTIVVVDDNLLLDATNSKIGSVDEEFGCYMDANSSIVFDVLGETTIILDVSKIEENAQLQMDSTSVVNSEIGTMIFTVSEGTHRLKFLTNQTYVKTITLSTVTTEYTIGKISNEEVTYDENIILDTKSVKKSSIKYYQKGTPIVVTNCLNLIDGACIKVHVNGRARVRINCNSTNSQYIMINGESLPSGITTYDYLYKGLESDLVIKSSDSTQIICIYSINVIDKYTSSGECILQLNNNDITTDELKPNTLTLDYIIDGQKLHAYDSNGDGIISGPYIINGVVDYNNRTFSITTSEPFEGNLIANYSYFTDLNIQEGSSITCDYFTEKSTDITEIGFENENHELLAYMNFPKVQSVDIQNYISTIFVMKKIITKNV